MSIYDEDPETTIKRLLHELADRESKRDGVKVVEYHFTLDGKYIVRAPAVPCPIDASLTLKPYGDLKVQVPRALFGTGVVEGLPDRGADETDEPGPDQPAKVERLVAAKLWLEELEAQLSAAAAAKWHALSSVVFDDHPDGYEARARQVDSTGPIRAEVARARGVLVGRALEVVGDREAWPAGGTEVARACALADAKLDQADAAVVANELLALRVAHGIGQAKSE